LSAAFSGTLDLKVRIDPLSETVVVEETVAGVQVIRSVDSGLDPALPGLVEFSARATSSFCPPSFGPWLGRDCLPAAPCVAERRQHRHDGGSDVGLCTADQFFRVFGRAALGHDPSFADAAWDVFRMGLGPGLRDRGAGDAFDQPPLGGDCAGGICAAGPPAIDPVAAPAFCDPALRLVLHELRADAPHADGRRCATACRGGGISAEGDQGRGGCGIPLPWGTAPERGAHFRDAAAGSRGLLAAAAGNLAEAPTLCRDEDASLPERSDPGRCPVVAGLCGRMHDRIGSDFCDEVQNTLPVPNIEFVVGITLDLAGQTCLVPARVSLRTKKYSALVVVNAVNRATLPGEKKSYFRTNEAGGSGDEDFHGRKS